MQMLPEAEYMSSSMGQPYYDNDLLFIREDLAEEWGAAIGYLECSCEVRDRSISEQFYEAAQDEIGHIIRLTRMLATLDQVQGEALNKEGLFWLSGIEHQAATVPPISSKSLSRDETEKNYRQVKATAKRNFELDDLTVECLRNAIRDELMAINVYQRQVRASVNLMVQNTLITIMNQKKEHVAGFSNSLHKLLRDIDDHRVRLFN